MANYIYGAIALNGGGTGSLDSIDGSDLATGDAAIVFTSSATYIYNLDESSGGTEDSPNLISPDANAENKRWVLVSSRAAESSLDTSAFNGILDLNDDDVQKALSTIDDIFNTNDFVITPGSVELKDTVVKSITTDGAAVVPSSHTIAIKGDGNKISVAGSGNEATISMDDLSIKVKTSAYTILATDDIIIGDCSGGNVELTLPPAGTKSEVSIFKKSNSNILTVNCYGSETIEAQASFQILDEYGTLRLISDGVNTWVTSAQMYDLPTATATILGAIKIGDSLQINSGVVDVDYSAVDVDIIPDADITRSLGSASKQWKDVFVGPGSLYVNGQKVLHDDSGTIIVSADIDQNLQMKTTGTGDIELLTANTGVIQLKGNLSVLAGKNIMSSDGNGISFSNNINMGGRKIYGLGAPTSDDDAATKAWVVSQAGNASNLTTGTIPSSVLPPIAITTTQVAVSEIAMLALTTQEGDVVVRTDLSRSFIRNAAVSGTMADFNELATPVDAVLSVNGKTSTVILTQDDVSDGTTYVRTTNNFTDTLKTKLDAVESGAEVNMTPTELLTAIKTVDGTGSGLDSDLLDGMSSTTAATANTIVARDVDGYVHATRFSGDYVHSNHAQTARDSDTVFYSSTATAMYKNTAAGFKASLDLDQVDNIGAATGATGDTIVLRDASGNFAANIITATATQTRYADLAEKYTCANEKLVVGTVVCACEEGDYEVEECMTEKCLNVIGIISNKAATIMDNDLEDSVVVGLAGKVPVRIVGPIKKGMPIVSEGNGCARQIQTDMELLYKIGVALETNYESAEKLVYCAIK